MSMLVPASSDRNGPSRPSSQVIRQPLADDENAALPVVPTTTSMHLVCCHACGLLGPQSFEGAGCTRCGAALHDRKPDSQARAWAFLIAAMILHVPANLLPIMVTQSIDGTSSATIFSGVVYFWVSGSKALAVLVLISSMVVPLLKMMALMLLLLSVRLRTTWRIRQQTRLYRLVEAIGRWSMLDVFVVALLSSLIRAGALATVTPGPGLLAFSCVVLLTMLASHSFDPRLLWEALDKGND
ncbi:paraquat-inducible protein A [Burkholderia pseudomultivorans]|uniref:Paraquat-inducible protein A n=1 Tax=Burkholderia pseudomultivorans TaxID=1207504 RepID=A0A132F480_9BURK|nr:paraquat-inducible protein A [Burkholderia pseudomultivorans]KWF68803.1 paraquat-inducible protein A [Burkholderia pseudomultivorans]